MLVEVSCGACLAIAYNLNKKLEKTYKNVVVIVCGVSGINLEEIINTCIRNFSFLELVIKFNGVDKTLAISWSICSIFICLI